MNVDLKSRQRKDLDIFSVRSTLLLENNSFTPLPEWLCIMVSYSPSSSSLRA